MAKVKLVNLSRAMEQLEALQSAGVEKVVINLYSNKSEPSVSRFYASQDVKPAYRRLTDH